MRGVPIPKLIAAVIVLTVITSVIMLIPNWDGQQASTAAPKIDDLLDVMIVLSSFVFSIVLVMLVYSLWRWRVRPGDEGDGAPIHGNTRLEIAWTVIPTVIVLFGAIYSWVTLSDIEAHDPDRMVVDVYWPAVRVALQLPDPGRHLARAARARRPADRVPNAQPRRDPLVLGAGVADQEGRRPRHHHPRLHHARPRPRT